MPLHDLSPISLIILLAFGIFMWWRAEKAGCSRWGCVFLIMVLSALYELGVAVWRAL